MTAAEPVTAEPGAADEPGSRWVTVCRLDRLQVGRGVAALLGSTQVALFRWDTRAVFAIGNVDPRSGAAVLCRGIVGDRSGEPVVVSPIYKQAFSLVTGQCLDDPGQEVQVYQVRLVSDRLQVELS